MLGALLVLVGCGGQTLDLDDYNTSCQSAADCVAVFIGDVCDCDDRCPNAAINRASLVSYAEDAEATSCGWRTRCELPQTCPQSTPLCINRLCQLPQGEDTGDAELER